MFGIGSTELLVILVVALIVLGPKSLPQIAKTLGKAMGEFRRVSTEFQRTMNAEVEQEDHEKRKKEAEKEIFGTDSDKAKAADTGAGSKTSNAGAGSATNAETGASSGQVVDVTPGKTSGPVAETKAEAASRPPAEATVAKADSASVAETKPAADTKPANGGNTDYVDDVNPDSPLARAVAKARMEADLEAGATSPGAGKTAEAGKDTGKTERA